MNVYFLHVRNSVDEVIWATVQVGGFSLCSALGLAGEPAHAAAWRLHALCSTLLARGPSAAPLLTWEIPVTQLGVISFSVAQTNEECGWACAFSHPYT